MARKPRISFPGALHHILIRGNHKEPVFLCNQDRQRFINLIKEYHDRFFFKCYAYALMKNHIHLLIKEGNSSLSKIMQGINQSYTQYFNSKYEKVGHLFQGRYKSILCDSNAYLFALIRYIHLNPVWASLAKKPEEYRWSSHNAYLSNKGESFIDKDFVLSQFSNRKKEAVEKFIQFIHDGLDEKVPLNFESGYFLADEQFIDAITSKFLYQNRETSRISLDEIVNLVTREFCVEKEVLLSKSRNRQASKIRGLISHLARDLAGLPMRSVCDYFSRSTSAISTSTIKFEQRLRKEKYLSKKVKNIADQLRNKRNMGA